MAEYKGIKGFKVQYLDADPVPAVAGWSAGGNLGTARYGLAGAGTQTAGLAFGGYTTVQVTNTELYNGSTWTTSGSMNTARQDLGGAGTQTAALGFGGNAGTPNSVNATENITEQRGHQIQQV